MSSGNARFLTLSSNNGKVEKVGSVRENALAALWIRQAGGVSIEIAKYGPDPLGLSSKELPGWVAELTERQQEESVQLHQQLPMGTDAHPEGLSVFAAFSSQLSPLQ